MAKTLMILKATGEEVPYDPQHVIDSLVRSGAPKTLAEDVTRRVSRYVRHGMTTGEIYRYAYKLLRKSNHNMTAALYGLRQAIMNLGPTGYPFEQFVGELMKIDGYNVKVGEVVEGFCVNHEVDVIAQKGEEHMFVECKFHNRRGYHTDVKVPLYIHSRFRDIEKKLKDTGDTHRDHKMWIVTNTKFTKDAAQYGECAGLELLGWNYPRRKGLEKIIEQSGLFPITCFESVGQNEKEILLKNNIILCKDVAGMMVTELQRLGIKKGRANSMMAEAEMVCGYKKN